MFHVVWLINQSLEFTIMFCITITHADRTVYSYVLNAPSSAHAYNSVADDDTIVRIEVRSVHDTADSWDYV
jgi:hypothetical protein